jgi:hypothetical protein
LFKLSESQMEAIGAACSDEDVSSAASEIYLMMRKVAPDALRERSEQSTTAIIEEVIRAAWNYGITDFEDHCKWSYVRIVSGLEFYNLPTFRYFLDEPLIHPKSKATNIVIAFQAAAEGRT